jgi:hypothetical protein
MSYEFSKLLFGEIVNLVQKSEMKLSKRNSGVYIKNMSFAACLVVEINNICDWHAKCELPGVGNAHIWFERAAKI